LAVFFFARLLLLWREIGLESFKFKNFRDRILLADIEFLSTASVDHIGMYGVTPNQLCVVAVTS
jgi:hypothetical protein